MVLFNAKCRNPGCSYESPRRLYNSVTFSDLRHVSSGIDAHTVMFGHIVSCEFAAYGKVKKWDVVKSVEIRGFKRWRYRIINWLKRKSRRLK